MWVKPQEVLISNTLLWWESHTHTKYFPPYIDNRLSSPPSSSLSLPLPFPLLLPHLPIFLTLPPRVTNRANTFCLQKRRGHGEGRGLAAMFIGTLDNIRDTKPPPFRILLHTVSPPPLSWSEFSFLNPLLSLPNILPFSSPLSCLHPSIFFLPPPSLPLSLPPSFPLREALTLAMW